MVEPQPSKLMTWVRFPLPAPKITPMKFYNYLKQMDVEFYGSIIL